LSISASQGYNSPTATLFSSTVTGNVTVTIKAGVYVGYWRTVYTKASTSSSVSVTGLKTNATQKLLLQVLILLFI